MASDFTQEMKELLLKERAELIAKMQGDNDKFKTEATTGRGDSVDLASD